MKRKPRHRRFLIADCDESILRMIMPKDGTLDGFTEHFSTLTAQIPELKGKISTNEAQALFKEGYRRIDRSPQNYGWLRDGLIVASAADILIQAGVVAGEILDSFEALLDPEARRTTIQQIFAASYPFGITELQPHAAAVLNELRQAGFIIKVVTNAPTEKARTKLQDRSKRLPLGQSIDWLFEHVHGDAEKSRVARPELTIQNPHLERPIFYYRDKLFELLDTFCQPDDELIFLGDNADMDIHPGCEYYRAQEPIGILLANSRTPWYDRRYFSETPNRFLVETWDELRAILLP